MAQVITLLDPVDLLNTQISPTDLLTLRFIQRNKEVLEY